MDRASQFPEHRGRNPPAAERACTALLLLPFVLALTSPALTGDPPPEDAARRFRDEIQPFTRTYCAECHGERRQRADINLQAYEEHTSLTRDRKVWERVLRMASAREMPPPKAKQPAEVERQGFVAALAKELARFDCSGSVDPGRVTVRRLNRSEYRNTVRDLLGVDYEAESAFAADEVGYGFDNIGDVLSLDPLLLEKYLHAAEDIAARVIARDQEPPAPKVEPLLLACLPHGELSPEACARRTLEPLARRAYRRPLREGELERLAGVVTATLSSGGAFADGMESALAALLVSPHFLFRVEVDPTAAAPGSAFRLNAWELASRLSYFLWSSMPDEGLFALAAQGRLLEDEVVAAQVRRMLDDPRAEAFVENFAGQWLQTRLLDTCAPDAKLFPGFTDRLRHAMRRETLLFFAAVLREDRSILDLIDADFTFLNEDLARHYGIEGVEGDAFRRVALAGGPRGGILTQASVLTLTSNPTRTSPVKRGLWVLDQVHGAPPPPPPPDAGVLKEDQEAILSGSLRQRMEKHRSDPNCAVCHRDMDAIGFAFENFDAVGAWRDFDGVFQVDASGTLPSGASFDGPKGLKETLKARKRDFARALTEKVLTYAIGRGLEHYDRCAVEQVLDTLEKDGYKLRSLITAVVETEPFRMRRAG
jgi:hypothetical protein